MITIQIPTKNKSDFIIPLLDYYAKSGYKGVISIGDSSTDEFHIKQTKKAVQRLQGKGKLNITYAEYPGLDVAQTIHEMNKHLTTPYVVFGGDDDYFVVEGLDKCIVFLDEHPEYASANGNAIVFTVEEGGLYATGRPYKLTDITDYYACDRLRSHMKNYTVSLFSVHRKISWISMYSHAYEIQDNVFNTELLPCCISVIQGKSKHLDCDYLHRKDHPNRFKQQSIFEWTTSQDFKDSKTVFLKILMDEVANIYGKSWSYDRRCAEKALKDYIFRAKVSELKSRIGAVLRHLYLLRA